MKIVDRPLDTIDRVNEGVTRYDNVMFRQPYEPTALASMTAGIESTFTLTDHLQGNWRSRHQFEGGEENFDPIAELPDELLAFTSEAMTVRNRDQWESFLNSAWAEKRRDEILSYGGPHAAFGQIVGTLGSPEFLPMLMYNPSMRSGIMSSMVKLGALTAGETAVHEASLHRYQMERDWAHSIQTTALAGIIGATLGAGIGAWGAMGQRYAKDLAKRMDELGTNNGIQKFDDPVPTPLDKNGDPIIDPENIPGSLSAAGRKFDPWSDTPYDHRVKKSPWKAGWVTPVRNIWNSKSQVAHRFLNKAFGHDLQLGYNSQPIFLRGDDGKLILDEAGNAQQIGVRHVAKETAHSRKVDREIMEYYTAGYRSVRDGYLRYIGIEVKETGGNLQFDRARISKANRKKYAEFSREVRWAMSHNDIARAGIEGEDIVTQVAQDIRKQVYDPIEQLGRQEEMLGVEELTLLKKNIERIDKELLKIQDVGGTPEYREGAGGNLVFGTPAGPQSQRVTQLLAEKERLKELIEQHPWAGGQAKWADSYMNRRLNRRNIMNDEILFKKVAFQRYADEIARLNMETVTSAKMKSILKLERKISERPGVLASREEALTAKLEEQTARLADMDQVKDAKALKDEIADTEAELQTVKQLIEDDTKLAQWDQELQDIEYQYKLSRSEVSKRETELNQAITMLREQKRQIPKGKAYADDRVGAQKAIDEAVADKAEQMAAIRKTRDDLKEARDTGRTMMKERRAEIRKKVKADRDEIAALKKEVRKLERAKPAVRQEGKVIEARNRLQRLRRTIKDDRTAAYMQERLSDKMDELSAMKSEDFKHLNDQEWVEMVQNEVNDTYDKIIMGEMNADVFHAPGDGGVSLRERKMPLTDDDLLNGGGVDSPWVHTDMVDQIKAYVNSTYRPIRAKQAFGDTEMSGAIDDVIQDYRVLRDKFEEDVPKRLEAAGKKGEKELEKERKKIKRERTALQNEQKEVVHSFELLRNRYYGRREINHNDTIEKMANIGRILRNFNVLTKMGGVLFTSAGDIARINLATAYAPELGGMGPGLAAAKDTLKVSRKAFERAGFAHEAVSMAKLSRWLDVADPLQDGAMVSEGMERLLTGSQQWSRGLMKATGLAEWTDYMKLLAASMTQNQLVRQMTRYGDLSTNTKAVLAEMGVDQKFVSRFMKEMEAGHIKAVNDEAHDLNWDAWGDQELAREMKDVLFRQSERLLVTPRETDLPAFVDNEMGKLFFQFKSFSMAAHNQITIPMIERTKMGDLRMATAVMGMLSSGMFVEFLKLGAAGRLDELEKYAPQDFALAAIDRSGLIPALMMAFNNVDLAAGNKLTDMIGAMPTSRISDRAIAGVLGPSMGTIGDMIRLSSGVLGDGMDERDARTFRRLLPFNNLAWTRWIVDQGQERLSRNLEENPYR